MRLGGRQLGRLKRGLCPKTVITDGGSSKALRKAPAWEPRSQAERAIQVEAARPQDCDHTWRAAKPFSLP